MSSNAIPYSGYGTSANPIIRGLAPEIYVNKWGNIIADPKPADFDSLCFAGGDSYRLGDGIEAIGASKRARHDEFVKSNENNGAFLLKTRMNVF